MSDPDQTQRRPAEADEPRGVPEGGFDLGGLAVGEADMTLGADEQPAPAPAPAEPNAPPEPDPAPTEPDERMILPRGALVAFRKSGGLRFSSRSCVVYRSGRVERGSLADGPARPSYLSDSELKRLRHLLLRARLASWERERPQAGPDSYSYEIAARYGHSTRRVELADHHIPHAIDPLVRALSRLLP